MKIGVGTGQFETIWDMSFLDGLERFETDTLDGNLGQFHSLGRFGTFETSQNYVLQNFRSHIIFTMYVQS